METELKPFKIYKSSAGSGKTYTLVLSYLTIILKDKDPDKFKKILAITFTNKASKEMKERILGGLNKLMDGKDDKFISSYQNATGMSALELNQKSVQLFTRILHNYGQLNIQTIDKFVHKLIRSFSRELGLTTNFELETNVDEFIQRCIDDLLESVGDDHSLTETLRKYSRDLVDDSQLSSLENALESQAKLLKSDEGGLALEVYQDMSLEDFNVIQSNLKKKIKNQRENLKSQAQSIANIFNGVDILELKFGNSTSLGQTVEDILKNEKQINFSEAQIKNTLAEKWLSGAKEKALPELAAIVNSNSEKLKTQFLELFNAIKQENLLIEVDKKMVAFSLLNNIKQLLKKVKKDNNIVFISDFNEIISEVIKNEPTPYIYEKMGNRFSHYFIDEFQDTSVLQWNNLIPLVHDSLAYQNQNLIVGDAKQSIYRWRGGDASQFINLPVVNAEIADIGAINNSFKFNADLQSLKTNYRSTKSVIDFNNWLFAKLLSEYESFPMLQEIYKEVHQEKSREEVGYVKVQIYNESKPKKGEVELPEDIEKNDPLQILLKNIISCKNHNYNYGDICVLVRSNKQGAVIAKFLKHNNISVTSQDSLLLSESHPVLAVVNLIAALSNPNDENTIKTLYYNHLDKSIIDLFQTYRIPSKKNNYYNDGINLESYLKDYLPSFDAKYYESLSIYDKVDYLIPLLGFSRNNIFLDKLLNFTFDFMQRNGHNVGYFLEHFDAKKEKISVTPPESDTSVKIMTIHKSKGLQFPVVMIPLKLETTDRDSQWIQEDSLKELGLENFALNLKEEILTEGLVAKKEELEELKCLDSTNLLYVALTRAEDRLYISLKKAPSKPSNLSYPTHLEKLISIHTDYDRESEILEIGSPDPIVKRKETNEIEEEVLSNKYNNWRNSLKLSISPKSQQEDLQEFLDVEWGKTIHEILQNVNYIEDINQSIQNFLNKYTEWKTEKQNIHKLFQHFTENSDVQSIYSNGINFLSERSLIDMHGMEIRPDKIIEKDNEIVLIDFKTGIEKPTHIKQIISYKDALAKLYTKPIKMYLIYLSPDKTIVQHV